MKGMHLKLLFVDLSTQKIEIRPIDEEIIKNYLGGRGLAVKYFTDIIPPNTDPLSPENPLIFATGPLTNTTVPTSGRLAMVTKSPLTGGIVYANTGGFIGAKLKSSGFDAVIIVGKSDKPQSLYIYGSTSTPIAELKSAENLWGKDTRETMSLLREELGNKMNALMIGPAGENEVLYASIMNDGDHRAFGRGGVGAVMGSKNLKAIAVNPTKVPIEIEDKEKLKAYVKNSIDKIKLVPITRASLPMFGTSALVNLINELGMLPTNNFQEGFSELAENISGEAIREQILDKTEGCYACPIRCGRMTKVDEMSGKGPEYESVVLLGSATGIFDLKIVTKANYLCNLLGLDTISAGGTIACAMELQQKGLLKDDSLKFGNADVLLDIIPKIANKEGIGADLALGSARLAEKYGAPEVSMSVKKMELPAYDPRGAVGHALGYATATRGGCHLVGYLAAMEIFAAPKKIPRFTAGGKPDLIVLKQHQKAIEDSLVVCTFASWALDFEFYARFATVVTGEDFNIPRLMKIGERIYNLERLYNLQEGLGPETDTLPKRFLDEPLTKGFSKGKVVPLNQMLKDYYFIRKWGEDGYPSEAKLKELGLEKWIKGGN